MNEDRVRDIGLLLAGKKNFVMATTGTKVSNCHDTGIECLVVMVSRKVPAEELSYADIIPTEIDGVLTDVQSAEEFRAQV